MGEYGGRWYTVEGTMVLRVSLSGLHGVPSALITHVTNNTHNLWLIGSCAHDAPISQIGVFLYFNKANSKSVFISAHIDNIFVYCLYKLLYLAVATWILWIRVDGSKLILDSKQMISITLDLQKIV